MGNEKGFKVGAKVALPGIKGTEFKQQSWDRPVSQGGIEMLRYGTGMSDSQRVSTDHHM